MAPDVEAGKEGGEVSGLQVGAGEVEGLLLLPPGPQQPPEGGGEAGEEQGAGRHRSVPAVDHAVLRGTAPGCCPFGLTPQGDFICHIILVLLLNAI